MQNGELIYTREQQEEKEEKILAPYAVCASRSRGRLYPEEEHPYRTCFQRDRDRIIHGVAFRRLEYKTQVFINKEGDHYRTRLTHTLEVAQISRTLARMLCVNEDLSEAHALAHDLGHPPFGHAGERILHERMEEHGGFEHNAQALRIVDRIERRYPQFPGLNLSAETRRGILKTHAPYVGMGEGIADIYPIECQIVDIADQISYTSHDLDDGVESGLLKPEKIMEVPLWRDACEEAEARYPQMSSIYKRYQIIIQIINHQVMDVAQATSHALAKGFNGKGLVVDYSPSMKAKVEEAKAFLFEHLYRHPRVMRTMTRCEQWVRDLFQHYIQNPKHLPNSYQSRIEQEGLPRTVCDYVSGMTDRYAEKDHQDLFGY